jgi:glycosyltransferase involved in cell wall biosynthesis
MAPLAGRFFLCRDQRSPPIVCSNTMPRALHVLGSLNPGGVERWLLDTVRLRGDSGWRFDFCLLGRERGVYAPRLEALGCRVLQCPLATPLTFPARLFALLRRERYDVVHSHVHHFSGVVLAVAGAAGVRVRAAHGHTCEPAAAPLPRRVYQRAMQALLEVSMTQGFACSEQASGLAGEKLRGRFRTQACGIDLRAFERARSGGAELRSRLGVPHDAPVVGHVGRLAEEKNHAFLLRVMVRLICRVPRARLVIVGGGGLRGELENKVRRLGLQRRVVFSGARDDVPELLGGVFDAFALPSLREGLPAVVLEAQAAGLPCVVSEHTPAEAVVLPERVERVALSRGVDAWAEALARALERPRADGGDACRRLRERGYDVAASYGALTHAYEQQLATAVPCALQGYSPAGVRPATTARDEAATTR